MTNTIQDAISVSAAAKMLKWPYHRTLGWIKRGKISAQKIGWGWIVSRSSVEEFKKEYKKAA